MKDYSNKTRNTTKSASSENSSEKGGSSTVQLIDNRPQAIAQRRLQEMANNSQKPQAIQMRKFQEMAKGASQRQNTVQRSPIIQLALNKAEKDDKLRILRDYVQFTPPSEFLNEHRAPPKNKLAYKLKLLKKIRTTENAIYSLKTKKTMVDDDEDDKWTGGGFNETTLDKAINAIYNDSLGLIDEDRLIGRVDAPFEKHDCVWAAITYALNLPNTLEAERALVVEHSSQQGEVEDSILYRIMEKLNWPFQGQGSFGMKFPLPKAGVATTDNIKGFFDGRYIMSEDKNSGGTQGHVLAVDVIDVDDPNNENGFGFRRDITLTDRQHERRSSLNKRTTLPNFTVYVWKVK